MKAVIFLLLMISQLAYGVSNIRPDNVYVKSTMSVGSNTTPNSKSILDLVSTTKGFLAPRMDTTAQNAISSPTTGLLIYNTTTNSFNLYNGAAWLQGATLTGTEILTNKTLTSPTINSPTIVTPTLDIATFDDQGSTPASPSAGFYKLYFKTDGKAYKLNSSGSEAELGGGGGSSGINILAAYNRDGESGTTYWSETGGGTLTTTTTAANVGNGAAAFSYDASANNDYASSDARAIPSGLYGANCLLQFYYKGFDANITVQVHDGTNVIASQLLAAAAGYTKIDLNFVCPSSGNLEVRFLASANAAIGYWDEVHLGSAANVGSVDIITAWESYTPATTQGFGTPGSYDLWRRRVGDTLEVRGFLTAGTVTAAEARVSFNKSGETLTATSNIDTIEIAGKSGRITALAADFLVLAEPSVSYFTFSVMSSGAGSYTKQNANALWANTDKVNVLAKVQIAEWSNVAETTITPSKLANSWSGYHDNTCSWARTNTAYGDPTADATCTLVERTNQNFGTVSTYTVTNPEPGIVFTPSRAGRYYVCALVKVLANNQTSALRLWDGTTVISEGSHFLANNSQSVTPLCGVYSATSTLAVTLSVQTRVASGTATISTIATDASAIEWSIFQIDQAFPQPLVLNNVAALADGGLKIARAVINCDAGSAITSQDGSWVSSVANVSSGSCTLTTVASTFSVAPHCYVNATNDDGAGDPLVFAVKAVPTTTAVVVDCSGNSAGDCSSYDFNILCIGAK